MLSGVCDCVVFCVVSSFACCLIVYFAVMSVICRFNVRGGVYVTVCVSLCAVFSSCWDC